MNKLTVKLMAGFLAAAVAGPVFAQDRVVTLEVDQGTVMASNGGEFVGARNGKTLIPGERIMITDGSSATVAYTDADGTDRCVTRYSTPGVYVVEPTCRRAIAARTSGIDGRTLGIILGAGAIAIAILASSGGDDDNDGRFISR